MTAIPSPLRPLILSLLAATLAAAADPEPKTPAEKWLNQKVPQLVLADGKVYTDVTFTKIEPDAITIMHSGGVRMILMTQLRPESQTALGYDPEKAAAAGKKRLEDAERSTAAQKELAALQQKMADLANFHETFDRFQNRSFIRHQSTPNGSQTGLGSYISISADDPSDCHFFLEVTYRGKDWIFMEELIFAGGPAPKSFRFDSEREVESTLHEWADIPIRNVQALIEILQSADSFRLAGKYTADYELSAAERDAIFQTARLFLNMKQ